MQREELARAAGFFNGEGYVGKKRRTDSGRSTVQLHVTQKDRRELDHFAGVVGFGKVRGPYSWAGHTHYRYEITGLPRVQAVIALLWNWLGPVKREQARNALTVR